MTWSMVSAADSARNGGRPMSSCSAVVNYNFLVNAVLSTSEAVEAMGEAKREGRDVAR